MVTAILASCSVSPEPDAVDLFIGTYGDAIYEYQYSPSDCSFSQKAVIPSVSASYVAVGDPDSSGRRVLYAVRETGESSEVISYAEESEGQWVRTGSCSEVGADPCFILSLPGIPYVFTADYGGGDVSVFAAPDGIITSRVQCLEYEGFGEPGSRQEYSHVHQIKAIPSELCEKAGIEGVWLVATDLGNDTFHVFEYTGDPAAPLREDADASFSCTRGTGPRHMAFDSGRMILYCVSELSDELLSFNVSSVSGRPVFSEEMHYEAARTFAAGGGDIHLAPDCSHVYTSHRLQDDGIAAFRLDSDGSAERVSYTVTGGHPRNFAFLPDGSQMLVASRDGLCLQVFEVEGGIPGDILATLDLGPDKPVCIAIE